MLDIASRVQEQDEEEKMWQLFLHASPYYNGSFNDYKAELTGNKQASKGKKMTEEETKKTVNDSLDILGSFAPIKEGDD